ncbi:Putative SET domain, rubisco LSMT, substrate-binding domain, SET domain superfamily [Colletotrichum destructivum]|uniref:SET domain, rubisco LSMT, substrate-binding domain, SET domain superfamily n=1 Tax=Colletotrichum destructivum TaxID=34406 RepID=A0AAX4I7C4_9PEZI|nr:Putative SET domain, rubisco LSMT, substrate-binding domain, SET domain superfamily [Colletotrichum destructivum]
MDAAGDFNSASQQFLSWFRSLQGATFHDDIQIVDLRGQNAGRGIIATKDIAPETILFTIPRKSIINTETSELPKKIPQVFTGNDGDDEDMENEPLDSWGSLILVMIYEYLQGDASPWKPYFEVLPDKFDTLMFWESSDLEWLRGSAVLSKIGKDEADEMFRSRILSVISANPTIFFPQGVAQPSETELLQLAHRMGSIIMAYAFDLENEEEPEEENEEWVEDRDGKTMLGMVPMADILNADAEFNAHVNHGEDDLSVVALRPIKAGEEILNYYGPHPNSELLRRYGYVTPKHSRYDVVEIPWELVQSILTEQLRLTDDVWKQLAEHVDPEDFEDVFVLERDSGEPDSEGRLTTPAKVQEVSAELEEQLKAVLKAIKKVRGDLIPDKRKRDEVYQHVVAAALQKLLAQYPTTAEEDETLLASGNLTSRQRMAVEVRLGEKRLLKEALQMEGSGHGNTVEEIHDEGQERSSKRARTAQ